MSNKIAPKYVIFDTDMGSDDAVSFESNNKIKQQHF